jgi:RecA-family ATPase
MGENMAISSVTMRDMPVTAPDWIIEGFLKRNNTAVLLGPPKKSCKSWLLLDLGFDLSAGAPAWGMKDEKGEFTFKPPRPLRVVYFSQEDTVDDLVDRVHRHCGSGHQVSDNLWLVPKNLVMTLDTGYELVQKELEEIVAASGPIDLIIFDTMRRMHTGNENDSEVIARLWVRVDQIQKKYNCGVFFAHHITKPPQDKRGYDPSDPFIGRGSGDIYGGGDAYAVVVPIIKNREMAKVTVYFESKRAADLNPAVLKIPFATGRTEWLGQGRGVVREVNVEDL